MAGEFCNKTNEAGWRCRMASEHSPYQCHFVPPASKAPRPIPVFLGQQYAEPGWAPDIATEQREAWGGSGCCYQKTGGCERHRARSLISGTPATMLGEALAALGRTILLAEQSGCCSPHGATLNGLHGARSALEDLKRLADAREGR